MAHIQKREPDEQERRIHPTAIIDPKAEIDTDVAIGPYSIVGPNVRIGKGCRIGVHVFIDGNTTIGKNNQFSTGAIIGSPPQDLKHRGGRYSLVIGDNNIVREYATINTSTSMENSTCIGSNNIFMAYSHVAHDCDIHNGVVMANYSALAGHVIVEDRAILGGLVGIHQFVRVGTLAMIGGLSKATKDVMPYSMVDGHPARWQGINFVGLKRNGIPGDTRTDIKRAFKIVCRSNLNTSQALDRLRGTFDGRPEISHLIEFIQSSSRGVCK